MKPATVHHAGPLIDGVQLCTRCDYVLTDYRGAMLLDSDELGARGWPVGASIEVSAGVPRFLSTTDDPPNCEMA